MVKLAGCCEGLVGDEAAGCCKLSCNAPQVRFQGLQKIKCHIKECGDKHIVVASVHGVNLSSLLGKALICAQPPLQAMPARHEYNGVLHDKTDALRRMKPKRGRIWQTSTEIVVH